MWLILSFVCFKLPAMCLRDVMWSSRPNWVKKGILIIIIEYISRPPKSPTVWWSYLKLPCYGLEQALKKVNYKNFHNTYLSTCWKWINLNQNAGRT